jgi:hypothetical protein
MHFLEKCTESGITAITLKYLTFQNLKAQLFIVIKLCIATSAYILMARTMMTD